jgi:hypothetical protein
MSSEIGAQRGAKDVGYGREEEEAPDKGIRSIVHNVELESKDWVYIEGEDHNCARRDQDDAWVFLEENFPVGEFFIVP